MDDSTNHKQAGYLVQLATSFIVGAGLLAAQSSAQSPGSGGWPRAGQNTPPASINADPYGGTPVNNDEPDASREAGPPPDGRWEETSPPYAQPAVPARLTMRPGTFITVRVNQTLSSDRNRPGDEFSATLVRPLIVDGVVVAQRGQTLGGRVVEAEKAGRIEGTSRLRIQLIDLTLVDGQQLPIQSQFISRSGGASVGRDVGAVAGTTGLGAAIGAAAGWGQGAAIGAGAGAAAGVIGVLLTRGRPTEIYPESMLTFRIETPVLISTDRAPEVFRYAEPADYDQPSDHQPPAYAQQRQRPAMVYGGGYPFPYPAPPLWYAPAYSPYWGTSFMFYGGPRYRYYGPRYYPYRYRRWHR